MFITDKLKRPSALAAAVLLLVASVVPLLSQKKANAYALVTQRSITLSSSKATASDVDYKVSFKPATTGNIGGLVVEFCSNSPIIGDACTAPTGFNAHAFTGDNTLSVGTGLQAGVTDFQKDLTDPDGAGPQGAAANRVVLSRTGGPASISSGTTVTVVFGDQVAANGNGVTNPNGGTATVAPEDNITFYARIVTFATAGNAESYNSTSTTNAVDAGGVALSTANQLTITAKVQERLTFCVYTTGTACANGVGSSLVLGDANGVLDAGTEYTNNNAKFSISTNANGLGANSVTIRAKGGTLKSTAGCADGSTQTCSIDPIGSTATDTAAGTESFGFCINAASQSPLTANSPYDGATFCNVSGSGNTSTNRYAFDDNNTTGTQSPYGQSMASFNAATEKTGTLDFVGNIGATTEPGIYTTVLSFIATGTY